MRAGPVILVLVSLMSSWYLTEWATFYARIGGWTGLGWFLGVCASAAVVGATVGMVGRVLRG